MEKFFILYDGRAKTGDTDRASVLCTASSEREARKDSKTFSGYDGVWYEYDSTEDGFLINGKPRFDLPL